MDTKTFGQLALQLLNAAQVPGQALDDAVAFRDLARRLAEGELVLAPADTTAPAAT